MATEITQEDSVLIRLSVVQPGSIDYPERRIVLTESQPTTKLGRSSSRLSLGLQPAVSNGWYNSPVMSRHHAEIEVDFTNKTVGIRDLNSMHGTFLNKNEVGSQTSQPTRIRVGDEITLGLPVFRNREEFHPALVRVDGLEFCEASRQPTTTPTRTFTVPDDCSTDDNEPFDDEPLVTKSDTNATVVIVDAETADLTSAPNPWANSHPPSAKELPLPCPSNAGLSHQLDGSNDDSTSGSAPPRPHPTLGAWSDVSSSNGSPICNESDSAGPTAFMDGLTDIDDDDDDDQDMDLDSLHNSESGNELGLRDTHHGEDPRSPSWNSFSSDSEDEHMDDNESVLDESASEGFALFDDDSDEIANDALADGRVQPGTGLAPEQQTMHSLRSPGDVETNRAIVLPNPVPQLPPISSVISAGPNDWMSYSQSVWGPRSPSPSDAVLLPRHCRTDAASSEKVQGDARLDTSDQTNPENKEADLNDEELSQGRASLDNLAGLGQKCGKPKFFAARAANKMLNEMAIKKLHDSGMRSERPNDDGPRLSFGSLFVSSNDQDEADTNLPPTTAPEAAGLSAGFILAPHAHGLVREGSGQDMVCGTEDAVTERRSYYDLRHPYSMESVAWSSVDMDSHDPSSAHELQSYKQKILADKPVNESIRQPVQAPDNVDDAGCAKGDVSAAIAYTFDQLEYQTQELDGQEASAPMRNKDEARKGKRKAADISELSPPELRWAFSLAEDKIKAKFSAETTDSSSHSSSRSTIDQIALPSPPPSPEEVVSPEQRPSKKIRKIAERVGYAALGGVSVGAMVLTSLIYTAPNFV